MRMEGGGEEAVVTESGTADERYTGEVGKGCRAEGGREGGHCMTEVEGWWEGSRLVC